MLPRCGGAARPGPAARREQVERETAANNYWSSTTNATNPNNAWNVNFNNGNVNTNNKTNNNHAWCVRGEHDAPAVRDARDRPGPRRGERQARCRVLATGRGRRFETNRHES